MIKRLGMAVFVALTASPAAAGNASSSINYETVAQYLDLKDALNLCEIGKFIAYDDAERREQTEFFHVVVRAAENLGIDVQSLLDPKRPVSLEYREREKDFLFLETPAGKRHGDHSAELETIKQNKRSELQRWCATLDLQRQALVGGYMIAQASLMFKSQKSDQEAVDSRGK